MSIMKKYLKPHPQTAGRVIDGEAVLILADSSEVNVLNEVGSRIFELADGSRSVEEILGLLAGEYEVEPDQLEQDVMGFIDQMIERNIFVLTGAEEA